ncbi:hypothetical protein [Prauserella muralis]|uniref:Uncharacterized protein n=1 Tax=Prauserella muralis TaxID=588067 RepID=A0A2V4AKY5_9PSEU|nr:hypothetical protein [Prauserella muralis]PXY20872.1 hypothetical protein BAY60_25550 [Prauserella muralis]TWE29912.1 hypothetical protein FHX69_2605 [Prauserella muralis]
MPIYAGQIIRAADLVPTEWQPVAFQNGWRNYGNGWSDVQFRYLPLTDQVEIKGTMISGTEADNTVVFTLPEGYRPSSNCSFPIGHVSTPTDSVAQVRFYSDGTVRIYGLAAINIAAMVLEGIQFYRG